MANKKISQLNKVDGAVGITSADLFPIASGGGAAYQTASVTSLDVASFCLAPMPANQLNQPIGFTGNVNFNIKQSSSAQINFDKDNWATAGVGESFPYLQVDLDNGGKLVTGSGISVPAIADNMGDCVATTDIFMQGNDITGALRVGFGSVYGDGLDRSIISTDLASYGNTLEVKAYTDLTLSGNRHVSISGQALSLENGDTQTPISGNVIITGGNLEIDPGNKLIVNEIDTTVEAADYASLNVRGAIITPPNVLSWIGNTIALNWEVSNIAQASMSSNTTFNFNSVGDGQTLTMYVKNTDSSSHSAAFVSGSNVVWGAEYSNAAPAIAADKTNLYTFVRINTGIFASAVTGYVY